MRPATLPLLLLPLLSLAVTARAQGLDMLVYPNAGIFEVGNGHISGPGAAMLARLQALSGVKLELQAMPIARAQQTMLHKPGTCVVALPRTPEREAQYRWAGPWASSAIALYGRADETHQVSGPEDMRGAQIAVLRDSIPAAWLKDHGLASYEVNDLSTGLRMLQAGRVNFWLGNDMAARFVIKTLDGPAPRLLYSFGRIDLFIACHPAVSAEPVERLHAGLAQLRRNGELAEFGLR